ncbi:MAG: cell wall hydrolase [Alphaproteobacteria bacterium]|nr:cell wall hydrolase [Rhodospirillales bacterium]MCW9045794.1 cell wall hydrolase [Alphaproteobacteria bacterium]
MTKAITQTFSQETDILARTIYGEARGEAVRGKEAVACVIINRVQKAKTKGGYWWGASIEKVCHKPWQFSCWNVNDPNREKITDPNLNNRVFSSCLRIARRAINGAITDPTRGATHYHHKDINPAWARGKAPSAEIGNHLFYNNVE